MKAILIVDDDPEICRFFTIVLGEAGYRVLSTSDGKSGLQCVRDQRPDVVIADLLMPNMNGFELYRQIREDPLAACTPVIFMTGIIHQDEGQRLAEACGVQHLLAKPCSRDQILSAVAAAFAHPQRGIPEHADRAQLQVLTNKLIEKIRELETANHQLQRQMTDLQHAKQRLRENHALLHAVVEGIPEAVYVKDANGTYVLVNSAGARMVGKTVDEVLGRDDSDFFAAESAVRFTQWDLKVMESGKPETYEELGTVGSVTRAYLTTKAPFLGSDGKVSGVLGISRDITERKAAEETLRKYSESVKALSQQLLLAQEEDRRSLAIQLHEDLGQVLSAISMTLHHLKRVCGPVSHSPLEEGVGLVAHGIERVRQMSNDLRPPALDLLGLEAAARDLIAEFRDKCGTPVRMEICAETVPPEVGIVCYRVLEDMLAILSACAGVGEFRIVIRRELAALRLVVEGKRADLQPLCDGSVLDVLQMQQRVTLAGGSISVSEGDEGTSVCACFPLFQDHVEERDTI